MILLLNLVKNGLQVSFIFPSERLNIAYNWLTSSSRSWQIGILLCFLLVWTNILLLLLLPLTDECLQVILFGFYVLAFFCSRGAGLLVERYTLEGKLSLGLGWGAPCRAAIICCKIRNISGFFYMWFLAAPVIEVIKNCNACQSYNYPSVFFNRFFCFVQILRYSSSGLLAYRNSTSQLLDARNYQAQELYGWFWKALNFGRGLFRESGENIVRSLNHIGKHWELY